MCFRRKTTFDIRLEITQDNSSQVDKFSISNLGDKKWLTDMVKDYIFSTATDCEWRPNVNITYYGAEVVSNYGREQIFITYSMRIRTSNNLTKADVIERIFDNCNRIDESGYQFWIDGNEDSLNMRLINIKCHVGLEQTYKTFTR